MPTDLPTYNDSHEPDRDHTSPSSWVQSSWARSALALGILGLLYLLSTANFLLFHSLIEILTIAIAWGAFSLLWNARHFDLREAFLLLGLGLLFSGAVDLLHTLSYKGLDLFPGFEPAPLSTQLWICARLIETLGWLGFAIFLRRRHLVRGSALFFLVLTLLALSSVFFWRNFPVCFDNQTGLTPFKIAMEGFFVLTILVALGLIRKQKDSLDDQVFRNLKWALLAAALAELAFTTYQDPYGLGNVVGHVARLVSRLLVYRALIFLSLTKPFALFFSQLNMEKDKVAQSERRWRSLATSHPDYVFELDRDLVIQFANIPSSGQAPASPLGESIFRILSTSDQSRVQRLLNSALDTRESVQFESSAVRLDGHSRHLEFRAAVRPGPDGQTAGLTLVARDITRGKRQEHLARARLRISEFALGHDTPQLLQKVLDEAEILTNSRIGFFHFVEHNQRDLKLQAWSTRTVNEACKASASGAHYPLSQAGVWANCVRERAPIIHNDYASLPDRKGMPSGHAEVIRELTVPVLRFGKVVAVVGVGNKPTHYDENDQHLLLELADQAWDIVTRKRAEIALDQSRHLLAQTLANLPGMVFRCANDDDWTMEFLSEGCKDLVGYDSGDLIDNRVVSYSSLIHPDDRAKVQSQVQAALQRQDSYQIVYRIMPNGQPTKWVWEQGRGHFTDQGLSTIEGFIYDISDQILAQQERTAMEKKVQETQKLESLGVLAGGIAHDFNNLLQAMLGFTELAKGQVGPGNPAVESLERVMDAASKAANLTQQMLAFSGRGHFTKTHVDLSTQIKEMSAFCQSIVPKNIHFSMELAGNLPPVSLDTTQLQQIVMNLLINASEAIGDDSGTLRLVTGTVHCGAEDLTRSLIHYDNHQESPPPAGDFVYLEVTDTGCGMDKTVLSRVFEPFFTTKFTGRGLGMAAVQGIVRGHGGLLTISSQVGDGTAIRVLFPARQSLDTMERLPLSPRQKNLGRTVLVVDDEIEVRDLVAGVLNEAGYETVCAVDGLDAIALFEKDPRSFGLILLDLVMPRMNGKRCLERLRELELEAPVVIMSGFAEEEIHQRLEGATFDGVLAKPFLQKQLKDMARTHLGS